MFDLLIDLSYAIGAALLGASGAWWLRGTSTQRESARNEREGRINREILSKLHDLAAKVAADVGQHSNRVEEINEELVAAKTPESDTVITAVSRLIQSNQQMQAQLADAKERLRQQAKRIESSAVEARTDALTGVANRRAFDEEVEHRRNLLKSEGTVSSLLLMDVDHFKRFNDTFGHQAGDWVLHGLAEIYMHQVREIDTVARYGGEEFVVILPGTGLEAAGQVAQRIRQEVAKTRFRHSGHELNVTNSVGVAQLAAGEDAAGWIGRADAALYASKQAGRNLVSLHDGEKITTLNEVEVPAAKAEPAASTPVPATPAKPPAAHAAPRPQPRPTAETSAKKSEASCSRATFCMVLGQRLAEHRRSTTPVSVLMLRVDDEEEILSRYGQQGADLTMRIILQFLNASFREMDLVAQYEEATFASLLPNCDLPNLIEVAERLRSAIARCKFPVGGDRFQFTVSMAGVAAMADDDNDRLLARAQLALQAATEAGGNCTYFHNGEKVEPAAVKELSAAAV